MELLSSQEKELLMWFKTASVKICQVLSATCFNYRDSKSGDILHQGIKTLTKPQVFMVMVND